MLLERDAETEFAKSADDRKLLKAMGAMCSSSPKHPHRSRATVAAAVDQAGADRRRMEALHQRA